MTLQELQEMLEELMASRQSRKRAWENLQEIRLVIKDTTALISRLRLGKFPPLRIGF
jgi:hypothetical protein